MKAKKNLVNPKTGEFNLDNMSGATIQQDIWLSSPDYDCNHSSFLGGETMVHVSYTETKIVKNKTSFFKRILSRKNTTQ